jgi:acyl-CoA thioester hydrolase
MSAIFLHRFDVPTASIDANGHVNNLEYLRWMQDVATLHSEAVGWPLERYLAVRAGWFVRTHSIEYLRPAFAGDSIVLATWVAGFRATSSPRRYRFLRRGEAAPLAIAETVWVFVDGVTGLPKRVPPELTGAFTVADEADAQRAALVGAGIDPDAAAGPTARRSSRRP